MTTEYATNGLCESAIPTPPVVNLSSVLNQESVQGIHDLQNVNENIKHNSNVNVVLLHTFVSSDVALHAGLNQSNGNKRLTDYTTLPLGSEVKYSISYVCRLCANTIDLDSAVNIFPSNEFQENLSTKINKYLPIVVYESDPFPKTICKMCLIKINQFCELADKCVLAEEQFRHTYEFDGRYIDELTNKINQKSDLDFLKHESDETGEFLYSISDFHYLDNFSVSSANMSSSKQNLDEKKRSLDNHMIELKTVTFVMNPTEETAPMSNKEKNVDAVITHTCKICQGSIRDANDCLEHSLNHTESAGNEFPCSLCNCILEKSEWKLHVKTHFEGACDMKFHSSFDLRGATKVRQQKILKSKVKKISKIVCCKKCKEALNNVDAAVEHCLKHKPASTKLYSCVLCVQRVGKSKLRDHVSLHYPTFPKPILSCDSCNNFYPDEKTLKYHRCSQLRKYKCSQCKQGFKSEDRLKFHEDFHKTKSTFCDICKKDFKFESRIYLHFAGVHNGIREKPYCCDVCGKTFTWLTVLNSHKRTHTNERPFKCAKCDASFCNKYSLSGHMPSHDDHPQFYCDKCDYHTGRKQNLQKHVGRFHKEINSSQVCIRCKICNEIFPNEHHVVVEEHATKHSQEEIDSVIKGLSEKAADVDIFHELEITKLYQCERCERCYMSSDHVAQHRSKHAKDDTSLFYLCRLCESGFPKHDLLVKHQKVHVNIYSQYTSKLSVLTVISCDICGIECVDYRQLLNHKDRGNCMIKKMSGTLRPKKVLIKKHLKPLKTHQLFINSNGLFECQNCQRTYKNRRRYRLHLATHANI